MEFTTFAALAATYNVIPVTKTVMADTLTPVSAFLAVRDGARAAFLFESVEGGEQVARYSFLGRDPVALLSLEGRTTTIRDARGERTTEENFLAVLERATTGYRPAPTPGLPRLTGGWVGYLGYDTVRCIERIAENAPRTLDVPDAMLGLFTTVLVFDHRRHEVTIVVNVISPPSGTLPEAYERAQAEIAGIEARLGAPAPASGRFASPAGALTPETTEVEFLAMVAAAKERIAAGDIFQVVLSQRFSAPCEGDDFNVYRALRAVNPSPYLYYLSFDELRVIGSSPEVLVRKEGDRAETFPIAGTRPRGRTEEEDRELERELRSDAKERAEHVMLVDLGRNDIGRVAALGTVSVDRFMETVRYSHVMHLSSQVSGRLRPEAGPLDVLRAAFPAGTVSGAPKIRAMEIIDELERSRRSVYAGGVGYVDFAGNLDLCIAIRTLVAAGGRIHIQAGAGIVADSDPAAEFRETLNKARAMVEALERAGRIVP